MTTLQTHSARNTTSASLVLSGAQSARTSASDAPGFAGVLDAFTDPSVLDGSELTESTLDQNEDSDELAESDDGSAESAESDSESESADDANNSENTQSTEDANADGQTAPDQNGISGSQQQADGSSTQVNSTQDLVKLLNNAATIDIAALASQQLTGQLSASQAAHQSTAQQSLQSQTQQPDAPQKSAQAPKPAPSTAQLPSPSEQHFRTLQTTQRLHTQLTQQSPDSSTPALSILQATPLNPQSAQTQSTGILTDPQAQQSVANNASRSVQASQTIQAQASRIQTSEASASQRKSESFKSLTEIGATSKFKPIKGAESSNSNSAGFDLGAQSDRSNQHATRLDAQDPQARTQEQALQRKQILSQVQRGLASIINTKGGTMKLRMSPEHLGQVKIQLTTKDGHVKIKIDAETEHARSALKDGLADLRASMESRGVHVDELSIEQRQPNEFRLSDDASDPKTGDPQNPTSQHDNGSNNDQSKQSSDQQQHTDASDPHATDTTDSESPQPIWTELGLDAIA
ncbi:MAG: flagellar hook-length control protein FliK [Phycisphaerales bacterium]